MLYRLVDAVFVVVDIYLSLCNFVLVCRCMIQMLVFLMDKYSIIQSIISLTRVTPLQTSSSIFHFFIHQFDFEIMFNIFTTISFLQIGIICIFFEVTNLSVYITIRPWRPHSILSLPLFVGKSDFHKAQRSITFNFQSV